MARRSTRRPRSELGMSSRGAANRRELVRAAGAEMLRVGVVRRGLGLAPRRGAELLPTLPDGERPLRGRRRGGARTDDKVGRRRQREGRSSRWACSTRRLPSPSKSIDSIPPIVVHGTIAKCDGGGGPLGHPVEYIRLPRRAAAPAPARDSAATRF